MDLMIIISMMAVSGTAFAWYFYGSLFAPAVWYQMLWTLFMLLSFPVALLFFESPDCSGLYVILLFNLSFFMGCVMTSCVCPCGPGWRTGNGGAPPPRERTVRRRGPYLVLNERYRIRESFVICLTVVLVLLSSMGVLVQLSDCGISLFTTTLREVQEKTTYLRYDERFTPPLLDRLLYYCAYIAAFLSGMMYPLTGNWKNKLLYALPLMVVTLKAVLFTDRFGTISSFILFFSGNLASQAYLSSGRLNPAKYLYWAGAGAGLLLGLSFLVQLARTGSSDLRSVDDLAKTMSLLSPLLGFLTWYKDYDLDGPLRWGARTFEGLYHILGLNLRQFGQYTETVGLRGLETANVYSAYRGLIEDFSLIGALALQMVFGLTVQHVYRSTTEGNIRSAPLLAAFYACVPISFAISIFSHNSLLLSVAAVAMIWNSMNLEHAVPTAGNRSASHGALY